MPDYTIEELRTLIREELGNVSSLHTPPSSKLLTRKEAAFFLGLKENTLAVWATKGTGPAHTKICGCVRYQRSQLVKYINDNTMPR